MQYHDYVCFYLVGYKVMFAWQFPSMSFGYHLMVCSKEAREELWSRHLQLKCSPWTCPTTPVSHFLQKATAHTQLVLGPAFLPPVSIWWGCRFILWNPPRQWTLAETTARQMDQAPLEKWPFLATLLDCCQTSVRFDFNLLHQGCPVHLQSRATGPWELLIKQRSQTSGLLPH